MDGAFNILLSCGSSDVEVKRSHFICALKSTGSLEGAKCFIAGETRKHYGARHHCFCMRMGVPDNIYEKYSEDGEPQGTAGKPMLDIVKGQRLLDVCAVVTRYFGGTLLGTGGLVRAYSESLKEALKASVLQEVSEGVKISITCGYSEASRIRRYAAETRVPAVSEEYGEECTLAFIMPENRKERFLAEAAGISLGKAEVKDDLTALYYEKQGRAVIYKALTEK